MKVIMKKTKNNILIAIQGNTVLSYDVVETLYNITGSYDAIVELNEIATKYHKDIIELAHFLYN